MTLALLLNISLLSSLSVSAVTDEQFAGCLPEGISLEEVVSASPPKSTAGAVAQRVTIGDTLARQKARCKKGKLINGAGREVRFHRMIGCWGNPPADYLEQQERQRLELQRLKNKYAVVEIPCAIVDPRKIGSS